MSEKTSHIPRASIQRLAAYLQALEHLSAQGTDVVSSKDLAHACAVNPSQFRKDLAYFGEFGVRGVGYVVTDLIQALKDLLGLNTAWKCALVGVGNLGRALLRHKRFAERGFQIVAAFDCDPFKIGEVVSGNEVLCSKRLAEIVHEHGISIGIITTPPERAQRAANYLIDAGITSIITFVHARISVPEHVLVESVDFLHHFYHIAFRKTFEQ